MRLWTANRIAAAAVIVIATGIYLLWWQPWQSMRERHARMYTLPQWLDDGNKAISGAQVLLPPYTESGYYSTPLAKIFEILPDRQGALVVETLHEKDPQATVFAEIFPVQSANWNGTRTLRHRNGVSELVIPPGIYKLLVHQTPGDAVPVRIAIHDRALLLFPVAGKNKRAIQSRFGQARDGGRRLHEGVDIFAARNTPVIAAAEGKVERVSVSPRGGLHIWQRGTERNLRLYYAHLESFSVAAGQMVRRGEVLGYVGNSGNAMSTSPHLHFGVYEGYGKAVNPEPLLGTDVPLPAWPPPATRLVRPKVNNLNLRLRPNTRSAVVRQLDQTDYLTVLAQTDRWLRVLVADQTHGYVSNEFVVAAGNE